MSLSVYVSRCAGYVSMYMCMSVIYVCRLSMHACMKAMHIHCMHRSVCRQAIMHLCVYNMYAD